MQAIDIFPWNDQFNTNIEIIDSQHKRLVELLNKLARTVAFDSQETSINYILDELLDYTEYHFITEEAIWNKYFHYDSLEAEHIAVHQKFIDTIKELKLQIKERSISEIAQDTLSFLARWLASHILESDRYMSYVIIAIESGMEMQMAKEEATKSMNGFTRELINLILSIYESLSSSTLLLMYEIKKQQQMESKLKLAASVFENSAEGILITLKDGTIIDVNRAFSHITGYSKKEIIGENLRILKSDKQDQAFYKTIFKQLKKENHWSGEIYNRRKNGELYPALLNISTIEEEEEEEKEEKSETLKYYLFLFSEISAIKEHQQKLEYIAHYDSLTGLANRILLGNILKHSMTQTLRRKNILAIAYLDLDGFKDINDKYGHEAGDYLLSELAQNMRLSLRDGDMLSRLGGDEFVAVLHDLDDFESVIPSVSRLLNAASTKVEYGNAVLKVSASLGITFYPQSTEIEADQLLRQADQAMYLAKQAGKNRFHIFDTQKDQNIKALNQMLSDIRNGLVKDEFILHYQPKVNMRSGEIIGVEALIRWEHPTKGLLAPMTFLPTIEDQPLAIELGEWVISTALRQINRWQENGIKVKVSVNISAKQLQEDDFVRKLKIELKKYPNISAKMLELEILETSALENMSNVLNVISECKEIGVMFSIDDFGTGYSSLTYLKHLPVPVLKIDQSFVQNMLYSTDDLAILEGVLGLGLAFRKTIIAEGVETIEHGKTLLNIGYEFAQGYAIAKPMRAELFLEWSNAWKPDVEWIKSCKFKKDDIELLYLAVGHNVWIKKVEEFLLDTTNLTEAPNLDKCNLEEWFESNIETFASRESYKEVVALHTKLHKLANDLIVLKKSSALVDYPQKLQQIDEIKKELKMQIINLATS